MPDSTADGSGSATSSSLRITLRPSRILAAYLFCAHSLAVLALLMSALSMWSQIVGAMILLVSLLYQRRQHCWPGARELLYREGSWTLIDGDDKEDLVLAGETYIHPWLTILRFRTRVLPVLPDSAEPVQLRALRRTLRFGLESVDLSRR